MSFASLKKQSGQAGLDKLSEDLSKLNQKEGSQNDERFWRVTTDKSGNGTALIRFLPPADGESVPWVQLFSHAFQGPGGWYIENSLTTLNQKDPVSEYNTELWNSGIEANKKIAQKQKRKLNFISNILVVKDPANPENEGKVFLFKYGKRIHDKIVEATFPDNTGLTPEDKEYKVKINPFDLWEGANFRLRVAKVDGYPNYDKSSFNTTSPAVEGGDEALEAIWKQQHKLEPLVAPSNFKSYDDLKKKLERALGNNNANRRATASAAEASEAASGHAGAGTDDTLVGGDNSTTGSDEDLNFLSSLVDE